MRRVYADYNATTPLNPAVLEAMLPYLGQKFGNASSIHIFGRDARAAIDDARVRIAKLLGAQEGEIIFTGSGTEADNNAIFGIRPGHIITSSIEHHAVLHACQQRPDVTYLPVSGDCLVDPADLRKAIRKDTVLVSIMWANNETGTIQPISELAAVCREHGIPFHTDAVQAFGKLPVTVADVDLLTLSAHKFYGPKGVGVLYVRRGMKLTPLLYGGSHESDRRAGTENVAGIVGLAKAAELPAVDFVELTEKLAAGIVEAIPGAHRNGHPRQRVSNTVNFSFDGCRFEGLLLGLDLEGVAVSSGSACAVGSLEPSHVLLAMGVSRERARAAVRFSFGAGTTLADVDYILSVLPRVIHRLRTLS
ncbi:MAG: Cysteine desulfurase IscS [Verrucomicrobiae bacterium]|nr:Cysteine desulfurase IscS [Verrucomicrobiae bacterium]